MIAFFNGAASLPRMIFASTSHSVARAGSIASPTS